MVAFEEFRPRWASPPGDSIREALSERCWDVRRLAAELSVSEQLALGLLDGSTRVTIEIARGLAEVLGGSARFWVSRDARYCESLDWLEADRWMSLLPTKDMHLLGWVEPAEEWYGDVAACMALFGVDAPGDLVDQELLSERVRYRAKVRTTEQDATVAAWVHRVEFEAQNVECELWDQDAFQAVLPQLAALSRIPDPRTFVPKLQQLCLVVGVAVVFVRAPRGCPVSGVSMMLPSGTRAIGLSARYLADDHLWFTFFHEAGHLLLHDQDLVFVDDIDRDRSAVDGAELEADQFAAEVLLPAAHRTEIGRNPSPTVIHGLAQRAGVSHGVIVGQLQHAGQLPFKSRLNRLKRRYQWDGTTLISGSA